MSKSNVCRWLSVLLLVMLGSAAYSANVKDVKAVSRWPWNGKMDITYTIEAEEGESEFWVLFSGHDNDRNRDVAMTSLSGDGFEGGALTAGTHTTTWDVAKDYPDFNSSDFKITVKATPKLLYAIVDLSGGTEAASYPVRCSNVGPDVSNDTCRTTELWLRRIEPGTFTMGSPEDEVGRYSNETQHQVTLTSPYYIGVFECTQRQWELVMGNRPSWFSNSSYYATRPVEQVSYNMIRGSSSTAGAGWPAYGHTVDASSFMGKLQAKTGLTFDLPTEAQWEYACRAGTTTALNSGDDLQSTSSDSAMDKVGRYWYNGGSSYSSSGSTSGGTAKVGSYQPNKWNLYDMYGNVWEWCLDWYGSYATGTVTDPVGSSTGSDRVMRGGSWYDHANGCRSANRRNSCLSCLSYYYLSRGSVSSGNFGFRVALPFAQP